MLFSRSALAIVIPADKDHVVSLDGTWRFKLEQERGKTVAPSEQWNKKLAIDYPEKFEPFYESDYKESGEWHDIKVPGNWEIAGYSPATYGQADNASGFYRVQFDVPKAWEGQLVRINFDGVQNGAEIWLNGKPVKVDEPSWDRENYHEGGWTAFQVDLTPAVKFGEQNLLAIRVTKNTKSSELDTGDYFFLGGVHRPVTLFAVPKTHLDDVKVETRLLDGGKAEVKVIATVAGGGASIQMKGIDDNTIDAKSDSAGAIVLKTIVDHPRLWSAEFPNLYTMSLDLKGADGSTQRVEQRIGIREVTIKDGVFLVNGTPIKLAGICRHDVSPHEGTAVGPELWKKDIELMKGCNINAIRTSHYPYGKGFYDLCDEMGMYVLDELPYCWTPTDDKAMEPAFLQRARETVRRDKNHPSVIVWTVGNENKPGRNLQTVADLVKKLDDTRPRNVSEMDSAKYKTDISDKHYPTPQKMEEFAKRARETGVPFICVEGPNTWDVRLGADAACLDRWEAVMERSWDVVMREPVLAGTFLWEWQDRAVSDKNPKKLYYWFPETGINLLKIKGVVDGFRNPGPRYYNIKMVYSPIRVGEKADVSDAMVSFEVENAYSFTSLSDLKTSWQLLQDGKAIASGDAKADIAPLKKGKVELKLPGDALRTADALRVDFVHPGGLDIVAHQFTLKQPKFASKIDEKLPEGVTFPRFNLITRKTERNNLWKEVKTFPTALKNAKQENGKLTADLIGGPDNKPVGRLEAQLDGNRFSYRVQWTGPKIDAQELGWAIDMPTGADQFSWDRAARWTVYPDKHIGRPSGTATPESMNCNYTKWDRPDAFDFNSTKYDCNWASLTDKSGNGVRVEFDPKHRMHCRGGVSEDKSKNVLFVNQAVSVPEDISTNIVREMVMILNPGDKIEGRFMIGANRH
ncbi:MAG TPA: glycoside hydrolase family 2 TIM barrel-domain containing protein [Tepidisphaeraceae bacterium]|nr:glycoside hydrolase family 2 TIM barrel-domain containing protein [Tepidisphaeraceae bacterium]